MIKTSETLSALSALGGLMFQNAFRPMDDNDFVAFAGAEPDAQIAFGGLSLATALFDLTGEQIDASHGDSVAVIVSGERVEFHGMTLCGDPVSATLIVQTN